MSGFGRRYAPDERDRRHLMTSVLAEPPTVPFRYFRTGPVLDQGSTSSCVGHAWAAFLQAAPVMTRQVDPFVLYHGAQQHDEWEGEQYDGSSVRGGAKYLQSLGLLERYVWAFDAETVSAFLLSGSGTVVVGTDWTADMMRPDTRGIITSSGPVVGGHAYLITGYHRARGMFRLLNSWGSDWGQRGRAWIQGEHLDRLLRAQGEACTAVEVVVK